MGIFNWGQRATDPHESRTVNLKTDGIRNDPLAVVCDAIWTLITRNCTPRPSGPIRFSEVQRMRPVKDVTVQSFYVVYPATPEFTLTLGRINGKEVAQQIVEQLVGAGDKVFDPYMISKVGRAAWEAATLLDDGNGGTDNRATAANNVRLVEVFFHPEVPRAGRVPRVVGRESIAVEVSRLKYHVGTDPLVLAAVKVQGDAIVNPHLDESQHGGSETTGDNDLICIFEGRNANLFTIGSQVYDDILVEDMPEKQRYVLSVFTPDRASIRFELIDQDKNRVEPNPDPGQKDAPNTWRLSDGQKWSCVLKAMTFGSLKLSQVEGAPEVPPSMTILGRVLPRVTRLLPPELISYLRENSVTSTTGIKLEEGLYLYVDAQDGKIYLLNLGASRTVSVNQSMSSGPAGFLLEHLAEVVIDKATYKWKVDDIEGQTVGFLLRSEKDTAEVAHMPLTRNGPKDWVLGRQHITEAAVLGNPIFTNNPDPYLGRGGNLILRSKGRDQQGRPTFRLVLLEGAELLLMFRPDRPPRWEVIPWPAFGASKQLELQNINVVGLSNNLIFGTTYYWIKTSGTLR